ncbi:hypothetical protein PYCCODRAFT_1476659 [Trametes coccinea BRFM310]|uniref:GPI anchored protein n=1 Tax=Trametes coccinea (strain BRFM310) TaxID=1353009 RepID=A0A1Y2ISV2_TRAC3|nr:hypothetical protein PYCCODRAFT_1476659 [Trametes coccinea BRFM310]
MFAQQLLAIALFAGCSTQLAAAAVSSLYIPLINTEGVPVTVDVEGVDDSGHTTYLVQSGTPSGTYTAGNAIFPPGTLVADSTTAHFVENVPGPSGFALTVDCSISDGQASCLGVESVFGITTSITDIDSVSSIEVQVAATPTSPPPITGTDATGSATTTPTSAPGGSTGASSAAGPSSTKKPNNGAVGYGSSPFGFAVVGIAAGYFVW